MTGKEAIAAIIPSQNTFQLFSRWQCPSKLFPSPKVANYLLGNKIVLVQVFSEVHGPIYFSAGTPY